MADRVAVVTGAGRGVGAAIARQLSAEDWAVVVVDSGVEPDGSGYDPDPAEEVSGQIWQAGGSARPVCADVTTRAGLEFAMETATRLGSPTALVHAAGIVAEQAVPDMTDEAWRSVLAVHLDAAFTASRAFWPLFQSAGGGRIVLVGGADGLLGAPGRAGYAASKSGLLGLMRVLAAEGAAAGISANLVLPFAETRLSQSGRSGLAGYPNGASGARAEDVAPLVAWLCSSQGAAITGQVLGVRGAELTVWSQPRPVGRIVATEGWTPQAFYPLTHPAMMPLLSPLGREDALLGGDPIPVRSEVPIAGRVLDLTERRAADLFSDESPEPEGDLLDVDRAEGPDASWADRVIYLDDDPVGIQAEPEAGERPPGQLLTDPGGDDPADDQADHLGDEEEPGHERPWEPGPAQYHPAGDFFAGAERYGEPEGAATEPAGPADAGTTAWPPATADATGRPDHEAPAAPAPHADPAQDFGGGADHGFDQGRPPSDAEAGPSRDDPNGDLDGGDWHRDHPGDGVPRHGEPSLSGHAAGEPAGDPADRPEPSRPDPYRAEPYRAAPDPYAAGTRYTTDPYGADPYAAHEYTATRPAASGQDDLDPYAGGPRQAPPPWEAGAPAHHPGPPPERPAEPAPGQPSHGHAAPAGTATAWPGTDPGTHGTAREGAADPATTGSFPAQPRPAAPGPAPGQGVTLPPWLRPAQNPGRAQGAGAATRTGATGATRPAVRPGVTEQPPRGTGSRGAGEGQAPRTITWQVPTGWQAPPGWTPPSGWAPASGWAPLPPEAGTGGGADPPQPEEQGPMSAKGRAAAGGPRPSTSGGGRSGLAGLGAEAMPTRRRGAWLGWRKR